MSFLKEARPKWERMLRAGELSDEAIGRLQKAKLLDRHSRRPRQPGRFDWKSKERFDEAPEHVRQQVLEELAQEEHKPSRVGGLTTLGRAGDKEFTTLARDDPYYARMHARSYPFDPGDKPYTTTTDAARKFLQKRNVVGDVPRVGLGETGETVISPFGGGGKYLPDEIRSQIMDAVRAEQMSPKTLTALGMPDLVEPAEEELAAALAEKALDAQMLQRRMGRPSAETSRGGTPSSRMAWDPSYQPWAGTEKQSGYAQVMKVAGLGEWLRAPMRLPGSAMKHLDTAAFVDALESPALGNDALMPFVREYAADYAKTMDQGAREALEDHLTSAWAFGGNLGDRPPMSIDDIMALGSPRVDVDRFAKTLESYQDTPYYWANSPELAAMADEARDAFHRDLKQTAGVGAGTAALGGAGLLAKNYYDEQ